MAREETAPAPASSRPPAGHRRVVLHCDADAFFCQVERQLHPELYGSVTALAVFQHGDVIAADAGAKKLGVKKARLARRRAPRARSARGRAGARARH
jgi:nucleotidyltransferase/DNA polymerase involved in DNA repair